MKIEWVNHASFIFEHEKVRMISDPWMEGTAFDNGWALLSKTNQNYQIFENITHIWFSHEHPDHFSPPCLKKIDPLHRTKITILYHDTIDKKVVEYCKKAGFKEIIELKPDTYHQISSGLKILCNPYLDGDSYAYLTTGDFGILNLNDCLIRDEKDAEKIKKKIGNVDVLLTQFGYANKVGNTNDTNLRLEASKEKLSRLATQTEVFNPNWIIPFASYVYFCHEDNNYMNDGINRIGAVSNFIEKELNRKSIVLYPGDIWEIGQEHESTVAIEKYNIDYSSAFNVNSNNRIKSQKIEVDRIKEAALKFSQKLITFNNTFLMSYYSPLRVFLKDYNSSFSLSLKNGFEELNIEEEDCDISLNSDAFLFAISWLYGGDTLQINGRFQTPKKGIYRRARQYFALAVTNNGGKKWSFMKHLSYIMYVKMFSIIPSRH